jgi:hypothetical protein
MSMEERAQCVVAYWQECAHYNWLPVGMVMLLGVTANDTVMTAHDSHSGLIACACC